MIELYTEPTVIVVTRCLYCVRHLTRNVDDNREQTLAEVRLRRFDTK